MRPTGTGHRVSLTVEVFAFGRRLAFQSEVFL